LLTVQSEALVLATHSDPLYREGMATEKTIGYEFHRGFYADVERRCVLKNGEPLRIPLTQKEYEVLEFFMQNPKKVIAREDLRPLDKTSGRPPVDNYVSKIASKLGLQSHELFKSTRKVGYSLEANVRAIHASDQEEGGELYRAAEVHFFTHTVDSMRESLAQSLKVLQVNPHGLPGAHITAAYNYINLGMAAHSAELPSKVIPLAREHAGEALKEDQHPLGLWAYSVSSL
jgi:DNA-binding winged helix-turn-helix (wHTH) protein